MPTQSDGRPPHVVKFFWWALCAFLAILWIAGGASRADVAGQLVVRIFAWCILIGAVFALPERPWTGARPVALFLLAAIALAAIHLVPLPPSLWGALPGRQILLGTAEAVGEPQPWRPISFSPSATANAFHSLVVPAATLVLLSQMDRRSHWRLATFLLGLMFAGTLIGLLQFSEVRWDNPLLNDVAGSVSGNFANRNHFALFLAMGLALLPIWGFRRGARAWHTIATFGLIPYFCLMLLATGSRMGLLIGFISLACGFLAVRNLALSRFRGLPRKVRLPLLLSVVGAFAGVIALSLARGRAASLERIFAADPLDDIRTRALPTLINLAGHYMPVGSGIGAFDPVYRIAEPSALLQRVYLNHAHNDWLELVIDAGLPAVLLLGAVLVWYFRASWIAWAGKMHNDLSRAGSIMIAAAFLASVTDYPLRTPMMMAMLVIGAVWLCHQEQPDMAPPMPRR